MAGCRTVCLASAAAVTALISNLLLAQPLMALDETRIEPCTIGGIGSEGCSPEYAVHTIMDLFNPGLWRTFHDAGFESYAMARVFWIITGAMNNRIEGGDCILNDEAMYEAGDIWEFYVELPDDVSEGMAITYSRVNAMRETAIEYIAEGMC